MKKLNILFICKHNIFRSRIAEEYMKQISNHNISSAGLIASEKLNAPKEEHKIAKKYGLNIKNKSKTIGIELLGKQDIIVIVADNVPRELLNIYGFNLKGKVRKWSIKDVKMNNINEKDTENIIKQIMKKCDKLKEEIDGTKN